MASLLALASAVVYGSADFIGGLASRRASTTAVVLISQAAGLALLAASMPLLGGAPSAGDFGWGAAAGLAGGTGVALLYRALAAGVMAIVAPVTAVCAVTLPVAVDLFAGQRPGAWTLAGMALAIVAIAVVSQPSDPPDRQAPAAPGSRLRRAREAGLGLALVSGVAIGLFYLALARTTSSAGLWPLVAARSTSVALFGLLALSGRVSVRLPGTVWRWAVAGGALDMAANALYLVATRRGALSIVVTLASLYPASTVVLASVFLHEPLGRLQWGGIVCAIVAVALIVGGGG